MAGSTFQPPINLDPNQDPGQQTAFINQNFQSLASALETNSFRIVQSGTFTFPGGTIPINTNNNISSQVITHNLGNFPLLIGTANTSGGSQYYSIPGGGGASTYNLSSAVPGILFIAFNEYISIASYTPTQITLFREVVNLLYPSAYTFPSCSVKYYLLQETAN